jgi:hypothetical protein
VSFVEEKKEVRGRWYLYPRCLASMALFEHTQVPLMQGARHTVSPIDYAAQRKATQCTVVKVLVEAGEKTQRKYDQGLFRVLRADMHRAIKTLVEEGQNSTSVILLTFSIHNK